MGGRDDRDKPNEDASAREAVGFAPLEEAHSIEVIPVSTTMDRPIGPVTSASVDPAEGEAVWSDHVEALFSQVNDDDPATEEVMRSFLPPMGSLSESALLEPVEEHSSAEVEPVSLQLFEEDPFFDVVSSSDFLENPPADGFAAGDGTQERHVREWAGGDHSEAPGSAVAASSTPPDDILSQVEGMSVDDLARALEARLQLEQAGGEPSEGMPDPNAEPFKRALRALLDIQPSGLPGSVGGAAGPRTETSPLEADLSSQAALAAPDTGNGEQGTTETSKGALPSLYEGGFTDEEDVFIDEEERIEEELERAQKPRKLIGGDEDDQNFAEYMASRRLRVLPGERAADDEDAPFEEWTLLLTLQVREVVLGPLQENLKLEIFTHGIRLHRSQVANLLRRDGAEESGKKQGNLTLRFTALRCRPNGKEAILEWFDEGSQETETLRLAGDGSATLPAAFSAMGDGRRILAAAAKARMAWLRMFHVGGVAFIGDGGVVFSPVGMLGIVVGRVRQFTADQFGLIEQTETAIHFTRVGSRVPSLSLGADTMTLGAIATWWAGRLSERLHEPNEPLPIVWYPDGDSVCRGHAHLRRGGLELVSVHDDEVSVRSGGIHVVLEGVAAIATVAPELQLRIRGVLHRVWCLEGRLARALLEGHIKRESFTVWPEDWHPENWRRCVGAFAAARILLHDGEEIVLHPVECSSHDLGLALTCPVPATPTGTLYRGARVEVELLAMRQGSVFRATITRLAVEELDEEGDERQLSIHIFPAADEPTRRASRRSAHRVEILERVRVAMTMTGVPKPRMRGYLSDISAGGCRVILDSGSFPQGTTGKVRIPLSRGTVTLDCEVLHVLEEPRGEGRTSVGLRFSGLMEQGRSELQREVLWRERRNKKISMEDIKD